MQKRGVRKISSKFWKHDKKKCWDWWETNKQKKVKFCKEHPRKIDSLSHVCKSQRYTRAKKCRNAICFLTADCGNKSSNKRRLPVLSWTSIKHHEIHFEIWVNKYPTLRASTIRFHLKDGNKNIRFETKLISPRDNSKNVQWISPVYHCHQDNFNPKEPPN